MPAKIGPQDISLLWPPHYQRSTQASVRLDPDVINSLDLQATIAALTLTLHSSHDVEEILLSLSSDPAVIRYRQDILTDLLEFSDLAERLEHFLPVLSSLNQYAYAPAPNQTPLHEVVWRVGQLEMYVECVTGLSAIFEDVGRQVRSAGLRALRDLIVILQREPTFAKLVADLPDMLARIRNISSITIGVNLDEQLRPVEATLLSINKKRFKGPSLTFLATLFGRGENEQWEGIAPLHSVPATASQYASSGYDLENPMMYPLFRDLAQVLKQVGRPVAAALARYTRVNIQFLGNLRREITFYLGAVRLIHHIQSSGLSMCKPELVSAENRIFELENSYNINLAVRLLAKGNADLNKVVITNDIHFGPDGRIFILTGPNQGGKTTYTQAIGLAQVLAQAGLYVPGTRACISPVDGIYTHFPVEERPSLEAGRLGEEAKRLSDIFTRATRHSLILLNESLSSTSFGESLYLARDIVRALQRLGARTVYATHLHELAADTEVLNSEAPDGSKAVSLVSLVHENGDQSQGTISTRTYKIVPGPPMGRSYATEIASRYGISYDQLLRKLQARGAVDSDTP